MGRLRDLQYIFAVTSGPPSTYKDDVAQRTYGVNQAFRFVELASKESSNPILFSRKRPILLYICATRSELPSFIGYPGFGELTAKRIQRNLLT